MQDIKPQEVFANLDLQAAPGNDVEAARQCVRHALNCAAQAFADQGGLKNLAVLFQADSLSAEIEFKDQFLQTGCTMLGGAFESFDYGPSVEVEGRKYTKAAPITGQAMTTLGRVKFKRPRYRRTDRQGKSFIPAEHQLGLTKGNLTPAARFVHGAHQQPARS